MIKLDIEEFIEEVKAEMYGYEEIEEVLIIDWEKRFRVWLNDVKQKKIKYDRIKCKPNSTIIELKDETDIFKIVDKFLAAIVNNELEKYWLDWSL